MKLAKPFLLMLALIASTSATPLIFKGRVEGVTGGGINTKAGLSIPLPEGLDQIRVVVRPLDDIAKKEHYVVTTWGMEPDFDGTFPLNDTEVKYPGLAAVVDVALPPSGFRVVVLGTGTFEVTVWGKQKERPAMRNAL